MIASDKKQMPGNEKKIFLAAQAVSSLLGEACRIWNHLPPELEELRKAISRYLRECQNKYPRQIDEIIHKQIMDALGVICEVSI